MLTDYRQPDSGKIVPTRSGLKAEGGNNVNTGIVYHPERPLQPYTVWYKGKILWFDSTYSKAKEFLDKYIAGK